MKKLSVKTVVAIGIGAALFFVLGKIAIPSPVPNTNISLQYAIQTVFATLFGPIAGLLIGFIGHTLIDATSYGPWWSWISTKALTRRRSYSLMLHRLLRICWRGDLLRPASTL